MKLHDAIRDFQLVPPVDPGAVAGRDMADRLPGLEGARIGLLDNRKGNANVLLEALGEHLRREHRAAAAEMREKPIFSRPSPEDMLRGLEEYDAVLTAIGD